MLKRICSPSECRLFMQRLMGVPLVFLFWTHIAAAADRTLPAAPIHPTGGLCEIGVNPAATLLIPYFNVDMENPAGEDTQVVLVNTSDVPLVARVVVWNVDAWAVMGFNIWLYKHDVVPFSLRWLLVGGHFPNNGCSTPNARFTLGSADCDGDGKYFDNAWTLNDGLFSSNGSAWDVACYADTYPAVLTDWQCKLSTGSYDGWSPNLQGYITIDTTITCAGGIPDVNAGLYFQTDYLDTDGDGVPDHGVLENTNALMGDIFYISPAEGKADGVPAVHIEAVGEANSLPGHMWGLSPAKFQELGISTFWNKYEYFDWRHWDPSNPNPPTNFMPPNDAREPLPVWWSFRYIINSAFDGATSVDVWRSHNPTFDHWYAAGGGCNWNGFSSAVYSTLYDHLDSYGGEHVGLHYPPIAVWDEEEHSNNGSVGAPSPPPAVATFNELGLGTQRAPVTYLDYFLVAQAGWIALDFATDDIDIGFGYGTSFDQSWVNVRYSAQGAYSVMMQAQPYLNGCFLVHDTATMMITPVPTH